MDNLLLMCKYPKPKQSKTRLGKTVGYENSARFARFLLEDIVELASKSVHVTVVCPEGHKDDYKKDYPNWDVYEAGQKLTYQLTSSIHYARNQGAQKIVAIKADMTVSQKELDLWFTSLDQVNFIAGHAIYRGFYLAGMNNQFLNSFTKNLTEDGFCKQETIKQGLKALLKNPKFKLMPFKRDFDDIVALKNLYDFIPTNRTKDYAAHLIELSKKSTSFEYTK